MYNASNMMLTGDDVETDLNVSAGDLTWHYLECCGLNMEWPHLGGMIFEGAINFRSCGLAGEAGHCGLILGGRVISYPVPISTS